MNKNLLTLILVLFCFFSMNANDNKNILITVYDEFCPHSQNLIENTLTDKKIQKIIAHNFEYQLIEFNTIEGQKLVEKYKIQGFPTQIILTNENKSLLAYGKLSISEELEYLNSSNNIKTVFETFESKKETIQKMSAFEKFVFLESTLNYSQSKNKLILPTVNKPLRDCIYYLNPNRYNCAGAGGASLTFIEESEKPDEFKVAVFHPTKKLRDSSVIVSSFVENGKVTQQSRCFYNSQWNPQEIDNESHYIISRMECYVVTTELCEIIDKLKTAEDFKDKEHFEKFKKVLKSQKYKQILLDVYKFNFNKSFLNVNRDEHYEFYSKLDKQFYNKEKYKNSEKLKFIEMENSIIMKKSENLFNVVQKAKALFNRAYYKPCKRLIYNKIM